MNPIFFSDLDDTLLQSANKVPSDKESLPVSKNTKGKYVGRATQTQLKLKTLMDQTGCLIPVTGRTKDSLYRISWKWSSFQIVSHGALVLNEDGSINQKWINEEIKGEIESATPILHRLNLLLEGCLAHLNMRIELVYDLNVPTYILIKDLNEGGMIKDSLLKLIRPELPKGWALAVNGCRVFILPPYASKRRAVAFVKKQLNCTANDLTIGIGDSFSDIDFMSECDFMMSPSNFKVDDNADDDSKHYISQNSALLSSNKHFIK